MKLHLPKAVLLAILCVGMANAKTLNVGSGTSLQTESGFTVNSGEKVGYLKDGNFVASAPATTNYSNNLLVKGNLEINDGGEVKIIGKQSSSTLSSLRVTGTVTVGDAGDTGKSVLEASDCQIEKLTLNNGTVKLHAGNTDFSQGSGYLGAAVGVYTGLGSSKLQGYYDSVGAPKQAQILSNLTINGGSLVMGSDRTENNYLSKDHYTSGFGAPAYGVTIPFVGDVGAPARSLTLNQSAGDMKVYGFSIANSGMSISQSGGTMLFRDLLQFDGSKENKITQSGGSLTIGRLGGDTSTVTVQQTGAGTMQLAYGTDFSKSGKVNLTQSGGGTILLGGGHDATQVSLTNTYSDVFSGFTATNTTYSISQTGSGTVTVASDAAITASDISIAGTLENNGTITGTTGSLLEIVGGKVENNGTINMNISMTGGELTAADSSTFADITATSGTIYLGDNLTLGTLTLGVDANIASTFALRNQQNGVTVYVGEGGVLVDELNILGDNVTFVAKTNGTLEDISAPITLFYSLTDGTEYDLGNAKLVIEDSTGEQTEVAFKDNHNGTVTVTGAIPEPTTATLSLLALAALASRRRRK